MKIGILGSGALGLTAARLLLQKGYDVTIIEKEKEVGGLLSSVKIGDSYFEKYYHHIFGSDREIIKLIDELGLSDRLIWQPGKTGTLYQEQIYPLDSPLTVLKFSPLSLSERLRLGLVLAYLKSTKNYARFENETASNWLQKSLGEKPYKIIFEPLLKGKFGENYDQITMSWFWARVYSRTMKLGYLKGGFFQLYQQLEKDIKNAGGHFIMGTQVEEIKKVKEKIVVKASGEYEFDKVLCTLPTNLFFRLTPQLSGEYRDKYTWSDYYGAQTLVLVLKKQVSDYYWLNISDVRFPFLVYVEHTNFMPPTDYGGAHLVYLGNYLSTEDPRFKMGDKETFESYLPYLKKINPDFDRSWVSDYYLFRAPFAQPLVKVGYVDHLPPHETGIKNLYLANMAQVYPWDRGQNYSIKLAQEVVEKYL